MPFLLDLAWRDLRHGGRSLWVFCACIALGVCLVAATGGLYRLVSDALLADTRALLGGDVEVEAAAPLPGPVMAWLEANGEVSTRVELDTMLGTADGGFQRVELQSVDAAYPLYGALILEPAGRLAAATAEHDGQWGAAVDAPLADRLGLGVGDTIRVGSLTMAVRALVREQPDRGLRADWRAAPVLVARGALAASGLVHPASRIDYEYRVRTAEDPASWRDRLLAAFPAGAFEVRTFRDRSERIAERLDQLASGLLMVGLSTLFIGGLGVFASIHAYLQGRLGTIATLRALGLRDRRLATVYLLQVGILSGGSAVAGAAAGVGLALAGAAVAGGMMGSATGAAGLAAPVAVALAFGVLTAYAFALPAIGRALAVDPAVLFRGLAGAPGAVPRAWWLAALVLGGLLAALVQLAVPDPVFGAGFLVVVGLVLGLLEVLVRLLRRLAAAVQDHPVLVTRLPLRLAVANLHRPGSPLRAALLSLGSTLTLLVACTLVVGAVLRAITSTIPGEAPALVLYDVAADQVTAVRDAVEEVPGARLELAPLVRGRISHVNGAALAVSDDPGRRREARDEHKLSHLEGNIDGVTLTRGSWWTPGRTGLPAMALEDREAEQLGVVPGDRLRFTLAGESQELEVTGIYSQRGLQTRFWFEVLVADGTLDPYIHRYVGAAHMDPAAAVAVQRRLGREAPNVVTVRTEALLETARGVLGKAAAGLAAVAGVSLAVSLLVLAAVTATSRSRQVYDAAVLHALGARLATIRASLRLEHLLLAAVTTVFAVALGSAVALPLLAWRIKLAGGDLVWLGAVTALAVAAASLAAAGGILGRRMRASPAALLRSRA